MYTNDNNQHTLPTHNLPDLDCECQNNVYKAINEFISTYEPPYLGDGICKKCHDNRGEHLIIRPAISADNPPTDLAFRISVDSFAKDYAGGYEMRISFQTTAEDMDVEDEDIEL